MNEGMCVGLCLGVCIASAGVWDMGIGISLGLCAGLLIGSLVKEAGLGHENYRNNMPMQAGA